MEGNSRWSRFQLAALGLVALATTACAPMISVKVDGDPKSVAQLKSLAIVQFSISPPVAPMFPLIDAGIYKMAVNKAAPGIMDVYNAKVGGMAESFGKAVSRYATGPVLYGTALVTSERYQKEVPGVLRYFPNLANTDFPQAVNPPGGLTYMDYSGLGNSQDAFASDRNGSQSPVAANAGRLARALGVDAVMMATAVPNTLSVYPFGVRGLRSLQVHAVVYNAQGERLANGWAFSEFVDSWPDNLVGYEEVLAKIDETADKLARNLYGVPDGPSTPVADSPATKDSGPK